MGNCCCRCCACCPKWKCCVWCGKVCCCCSPCCLECPCCEEPSKEPLMKDHQREEEEGILTVTEDPSGISETQEMKVTVDQQEPTETTKLAQVKDPGYEATTKSVRSPTGEESEEKKLTRGMSWRLVPTNTIQSETVAQKKESEQSTDVVHMTFEEAESTQREPRNIVLMAHDISAEEPDGVTEVKSSFIISAGGITENK